MTTRDGLLNETTEDAKRWLERNYSSFENWSLAVRPVVDDGPGIPDQALPVLLACEETDLHHGSDLGLWLAHWCWTSPG